MGLEGFWLDVNSASLSLSLNLEDPATATTATGGSGGSGEPGGPDSGGLWETLTVTDQSMESWRITSQLMCNTEKF